MSLTSDLQLDSSIFAYGAESEKTKQLNGHLIELFDVGPKWYEVGAAKYRDMRAKGETPLPVTVLDPIGKKSSVPSRETGRDIPVRIFEPLQGKPKAVYLHIHGGGWVLQSEESQDQLLKATADDSNVTVVSVGYRLAPEHPFPAPVEDCEDAAVYLADHAPATFGAELQFIGGESAGAHLTALTLFRLIRARPDHYIRAVVFNYGIYNLSLGLPQVDIWGDKPLVLTKDIMNRYTEAFTPGLTPIQRHDPAISPMFEDLAKLAAKAKDGKLPPALFTCGTEDPLLDDTVLMATRWARAGSETVTKFYAGAPHAFNLFPADLIESSGEYRKHSKIWLESKIS